MSWSARWALLLTGLPRALEKLCRASVSVTLIALVLAAAAFLMHSGLLVSFPYMVDYGEAPLLDRAMRLAAGQSIYRRDLSVPPYIVTNYPPLYILCLLPIVSVAGPRAGLVAGRLLSVGCALSTALFLGLMVREHTDDRATAWAAALIFLAMPPVVAWSALLRVDMLALALSVAGLYVITRWYATRLGLIVTAVLLTAAVYTRQTSGLAAPLAACVWVWYRSGIRRALKLVMCVGGLGLGALLLANRITVGGFAYNVVSANLNTFDWHTVWLAAIAVVMSMPVLLILTLGGLIGNRPPLVMGPLLRPYLVGGLVVASTIGKVGSSVNYLLELCVGLALASATVFIERSCQREALRRDDDSAFTGYSVLRAGLSLAFSVQATVLLVLSVQSITAHLEWRTTALESFDLLNRIVSEAPDPVIADQYMGLLTLQGRPLYLQPFELTHMSLADTWDQEPLVDDIRSGRFSIVVIHDDFDRQIGWTSEMSSAVLDHYAEAWRLPFAIGYVPNAR